MRRLIEGVKARPDLAAFYGTVLAMLVIAGWLR